MKKYNIDKIYTNDNKIKITIDQTGSKAMIRLKDENKATLRQGFRVRADDNTIIMGDWRESREDLLIRALKREVYAKLAYKEAYYDLLQKLSSIGFILKSDDCESE